MTYFLYATIGFLLYSQPNMWIIYIFEYLEQLVEAHFLHKLTSTYPPTDAYILSIHYTVFSLMHYASEIILSAHILMFISEK